MHYVTLISMLIAVISLIISFIAIKRSNRKIEEKTTCKPTEETLVSIDNLYLYRQSRIMPLKIVYYKLEEARISGVNIYGIYEYFSDELIEEIKYLRENFNSSYYVYIKLSYIIPPEELTDGKISIKKLRDLEYKVNQYVYSNLDGMNIIRFAIVDKFRYSY